MPSLGTREDTFGEGLFALLLRLYNRRPSTHRTIADLLTSVIQCDKAHLRTKRIKKKQLLLT